MKNLLAFGLICSLVVGLPQPQEAENNDGGADQEAEQGESIEELGEEFERYGLGLLEPNEEDKVDPESVAFFQDVDSNLVGAPLSYNSVNLGLVSPVKNQGICGACTAFASTSMVETCYLKLRRQVASFSEQSYLDCAFDFQGSNGCDGAPLHAYLAWSVDQKRMASSSRYPYREARATCPKNQTSLIGEPTFGVKNVYYTYSGTEEQLKTLVAERGAVISTMWFTDESKKAFRIYRKGIFNACNSGQLVGGHAVTVVGYDRDAASGQDFWLVKNSWGTSWGEQGFFKLRRGVGACGIGTTGLAVVDCGTYTPSTDLVSYCAEGDTACAGGGSDNDGEVGDEKEAGETAEDVE